MSLIVDGVRSIRRKWFADKKLAHIKTIGVQSKTLIWDGFVFRVSWQDDIVSLRHISAPMGVLVAASGASGITLCSAESWLGPFTTKKVLQGLKDFPVVAPGQDGISLEVASVRGANDTADLVDPWYGGGPILSQSRCSPTLHPAGVGEDVLLTYSTETTEGPSLVEASIGLFEQAGGQSPITKIYHTQSLGSFLTSSTLFTVPSAVGFLSVRAHWSIFAGDDTTASTHFATMWSIRGKSDARKNYITSNHIRSAFPVGAEYVGYASVLGLGSYAFAPDKTAGVQYIQANRVVAPESLPFFLDEHDEENLLTRKWKLYYFTITYPPITKEMSILDEAAAINAEGEVTIIDSSQFLPLLDLLSGFKILSDGSGTLVEYTIDGVTYNTGGVPYDIESSAVEVNWEDAAGMLRNLFGWPNFNDTQTPHDSVMFHSTEAAFAWTRRYGSVEIRADGMFPAAITMPPAVEDTEGVRPVISHAGNGMFFCSCDQVGDEVLAVYRGTPFEEEGWEEIPLVTVGWANGEGEGTGTSDDGKIMYVRPVLVTEERIVLLAITRDMLGVDLETGDPRPRYCFAYADGVIDGEDGEANTMLKFLAEVPITDEPHLRFDVITYGNGEYTSLLREYPSPPPTSPQHSLLPYNDYPVVGV